MTKVMIPASVISLAKAIITSAEKYPSRYVVYTDLNFKGKTQVAPSFAVSKLKNIAGSQFIIYNNGKTVIYPRKLLLGFIQDNIGKQCERYGQALNLNAIKSAFIDTKLFPKATLKERFEKSFDTCIKYNIKKSKEVRKNDLIIVNVRDIKTGKTTLDYYPVIKVQGKDVLVKLFKQMKSLYKVQFNSKKLYWEIVQEVK